MFGSLRFPHAFRRQLHRLDDLLVAGAAAKIPADGVADLLLGGVGIGIDQALRGDQHAAGAIAALQAVGLAEGILQRAHRAVGLGEAFYGRHPVAARLHCIHEAGPHGLAVQHHRAGAADAVLAADMRPGQAQLVPQPVDERQSRGHLRLAPLAVHFDADLVQGLAHCRLAFSRASRSARAASTRARWRRYSLDACKSPPGSVSFAAPSAAFSIASSSSLVPTRRAAIFGNASGVPPAPPRPNAARTQRPFPSRATWAAAATIAKSPWRTEISVNAEPVCRQVQAGQWISSRHSSGRAEVIIGPEKNFSAS